MASTKKITAKKTKNVNKKVQVVDKKEKPKVILTRRKKLLRFILKYKFRLIALVLLALIAGGTWLFWGIPLNINLSDSQPISTKIFDRNGALIYEIYADRRRSPIKLEDIPDQVKRATIAIEDKDFYSHPGFSVSGMARAFYKTLFRNKLEGGSTLTQQLVKNALLTPDRTIRRKIQEFILSLGVEARYSKDEILEMYLNQIPYGGTSYGIEAAAETYFGKNAGDLSLAEASLLAGLPAAPSRYSPFGSHPELAKSRQETVLRRMVEDKKITQEEADAALAEELVYAKPQGFNAPHFALWVKEQLAEKYGEAMVEKGGLRVTTTLDMDIQEFAEDAVSDEVSKLSGKKVGNGAALVTRPGTGEILAMVGSKDYFAEDEDGKVNILFANRQPGSSIKPLNYALAINDKRITASTPLADIPTCFKTIGQEEYCPKNYDGEFHGATQTRFALGNSFNVPAVRVLALNGIEHFIDFARSMGITTFNDPSQYGLSLTLGGGEIRPVDMAEAFGVFANQGVKIPLRAFIKVENWSGKVLYEAPTETDGDRVLDSGVAYIISHILLDNNARAQAFGTGSYLNVSGHPEVSVKTGTTNDLRDNWTIGYTKLALVLTWVGNNDNSPMSGAVSGVSGASPIWNRIMKHTLDKAEKGTYSEDETAHAWPKQPDNITGATVCANTGALPNGDTPDCPTRYEFFLEDTVPQNGAYRQDIHIDRTLQQMANAETAPENIETQNHLIITDPLNTIICLDCAFPMPSVTISYPVSQ